MTSSAINHTPGVILRGKKEAESLVKGSFVEQADLINYLLPGDVVFAERGFTCDNYARMAYAEAKFPPFTKGKKVGTVPSRLEPRAVFCLYSCQASHKGGGGYRAIVYHLTKCFTY